MDFKIKNSHDEQCKSGFELCCDKNGNIFISDSNKLYMITIDPNNDLEMFECNRDILIKNTEINEYKECANYDNSLKKKAMENILNNDDSDMDDDFMNYKETIKYHHEDKDICNDIDNHDSSSDSDNDYPNEKFVVQQYDISKIKLMNDFYDSYSIYDTYIKEESGNLLMTLKCNIYNSYRLTIYCKNTITLTLNIVGDKTKNFELVYDAHNDNISCVLIK